MPNFKTYTILGLLSLTVLVYSANAQTMGDQELQTEYQSNIKPPVQIEGTAKELSKSQKDAVITLYEDPDGSKTALVEIKKFVTKGNGKFNFDLDINKMYVIKVEKDGYTGKMVDFDTDVTMAASTETKVPKFAFEVDLVKDLDGLDYVGSVARVFYDIRKRSMAYELDYTKEEQMEEERLARLEEEKRKLAELEAKRKFEREEAAQLLLEAEGLEAAEIIKATATVGGDEATVKKSLMKIYPQSDSLRGRKVDIIYTELEKERKKQGGATSNIDFKAIFQVAQAYEVEHRKEMDEKYEERKSEIDLIKQQVKQAQSEARAKENAAVQLEARETIAAAAAAEELRQKEEKAAKVESYYQAIFSANGNPDVAIKNLEKMFGRDPYKEEKAAAVYAEYEKMRKTGTALSSMNFDQLFAAADQAELDARSEEIRTKDQSDSARLAAFMAKVEARKQEGETETIKKIEKAIKSSGGERAETIKALQEAFSKNDPYKEEKARAIYDAYVESRKINQGGNNYSSIDFGALFAVAKQTEEEAKEKKKNSRYEEKQRQWEELEAKRQAVRQEKRLLAWEVDESTADHRKEEISRIRNEKFKDLEDAIARGGGDRQTTVEALMGTLPKDAEYKREKAEAMYDAYRIQKQSTGSTIAYNELFAAANQKEIELLEAEYEAKKADQFAHLRQYEENRTAQAEQIAQAQISKAEQEKQKAEEQYLAVAKKIEEERRARVEEQKKQQILFQREQFEKENARVQEEQARLDEIRRNEEAAEAGRIAKLEAAKRKKAEDQQKELDRLAREREAELAKLEEEKQKALDAQKKEELRLEQERLKKEAEEAKLAAKQAEEAARLAAKEEDEKKKEEARLAAEAQRKKDEADKAAAAALAKQKQEDYMRFLTLGNQAFDKKDYADARSKYEQGLEANPEGKEIKSKIKELESIEREIAKVEREAQALEDRYNNQVETAELAFEVGNYDDAIAAYNRALKEKPRAKEPRDKIKQIEALKAQLASEEKEKAAQEREYMLLLQDGNTLLAESRFQDAKDKFTQALALKPNEAEPKAKIKEIDTELELIALADEEKARKQREAQEKFETDQKAAEELAAKEREARLAALNAMDNQPVDSEPVKDESEEQRRQRLYDDALKRVEQLNLDAETQRLAFLSELAKIYPEGVTEETVKGPNYTLLRNVVNLSGVVTVYEKKIWDWGGIFYFKDTDIAITEALYNLELKSYK